MRKGPNHRRGAGCWDLHPLLPQVLSGLTTDHDCNHLSLPMTPRRKLCSYWAGTLIPLSISHS